jgi:hypothetical protein
MSVRGASSLLASVTRGHRGGGSHALQKNVCEARRQRPRDRGQQIAATDDAPAGKRNRYWLWLDNAITGLWVALLLSIIAYALVEGEAVLARLDGLDLVRVYSLSP